MHKLAISGSTIMSDEDKFHELLRDDVHHIEIGEFSNEQSFQKFLHMKGQTSFGVHSPLFRHQSKYDLIESVHMESEQAWSQLEEEARQLAELGAEYVLVHFPYFQGTPKKDAAAAIEEGLRKLSAIQAAYNIPFVCEPKLGLQRSGAAIRYLYDFPMEIWEKYNIQLCLDLGDYAMAVGDELPRHIAKWSPFVKVVHLHNVYYTEEKYFWNMIHPSQETDTDFFHLQSAIQQLAEGHDKYFVLEHTPHTGPTEKRVREGIAWVQKLIT